jgi:hypothetical protein
VYSRLLLLTFSVYLCCWLHLGFVLVFHFSVLQIVQNFLISLVMSVCYSFTVFPELFSFLTCLPSPHVTWGPSLRRWVPVM